MSRSSVGLSGAGRKRSPSQHARIASALARLPEEQRELLALDAWEGLDYGQLAVVLGCSRNAVRIRLHRARARLTAELADISHRRDDIHA